MQLTMFASVLFSVLYFSVSFPFSQIVSSSFSSEAGVAGFLGLFSGATTALTFLISLLVANRLYAHIGLVNAVLVLPITYLLGFALFAVDRSLAAAVVVRGAQLVIMSGVAAGAWSALFNAVPAARRSQVISFESGVPSQIGVVLSGLLLNVALCAVVRSKVLVDGSTGTHMAGNMLIGFGLLSILVAAFSLLRQKDIKRMFSYSSIENMGIATFAFGIGGPIATFGALLHMLVHSLTKSAIFFTVGHASQMHGTQEMDRIRGLIRGNPVVGWAFILGVMALVGMPPFGMFASEFLILTATIKDAPLLTPLLLLGLGVAFAAVFRKVQPMVAGLVPSWQTPLKAAHVPVVLHMAIVLVLGLYLPRFLSDWFHTAVGLLK